MVTCMRCRADVSDGGHRPQCPTLEADLRVWRSLLTQGQEGLTKPN
jgi:hypothetical protein